MKSGRRRCRNICAVVSDGDARKCLSALGDCRAARRRPHKDGSVHITLSVAEESIQKKAVVYDGDGDAHYDTISAFIKSMRGTDPDAALYWLAKMLHAGEDIRFIARRIIICASEDVGMADSNALVVATAALQWRGIRRHARGAAIAGPRHGLHRHCAEEQPLHHRHRQSFRRKSAEGRTLAVPTPPAGRPL